VSDPQPYEACRGEAPPRPYSEHGAAWRILDPYLILAILLCIFAIGPLLLPGYFWGAHDARQTVYFLFEFDRSIEDGILYPRWAPDFAYGYGYPIFNIYGPLSSYAGEFFHLLGFDFVDAVKIVFGLSVIAAAVAMYGFARRLMGPQAGLVAAVAYTYVPYHIFDLYVRAALAESVGFAFVPLAFWAFYQVVDRPRLAAFLAAGIVYGGLMFTSNLITLLFTPILALYVVILILLKANADQPFRYLSRQSLHLLAANLANKSIPVAFSFILGLGISAFFLLPALLEYRFVRVDQWIGGRYDFHTAFVYFFQLFSPHWGFGASIPGPDDDVGFQLGAISTVLTILSLVVTLGPRKGAMGSHPYRRATLIFFQVFTVVVIFLMVPLSLPVWDRVNLARFAQFPWRLLALSAVSLAFLAGSIVADGQCRTAEEGRSAVSPLPAIILVALLLLSSYPYLTAQVRDPQPTEGPVSLASLMRFQHSADEMTGSTAWVRLIPRWSTLADQILSGKSITSKVVYGAIPPGNLLAVHSVEMDSVHELLWVHAADDGQSVTFYTPYYPGWNAYIFEDRGHGAGDLKARVGHLVQQPPIRTTDPEGWIVVSVPRGDHFLLLRFEDTPVRVVGKVITLVSVVLVLIAAAGLIVVRARRHSSATKQKL
jgi:hypothetical protein